MNHKVHHHGHEGVQANARRCPEAITVALGFTNSLSPHSAQVASGRLGSTEIEGVRSLNLRCVTHVPGIGRGDRIRTCDLVDPNHALYQSELHPESVAD